MYKEMKGRIVVLTGAARGIGQGLAAAFAREGATVVGIDLRECDETGEIVKANGGNWASFQLDLTDEGAIQSAISEVIARFDRVDVLVNNAGILTGMAWEEIDLPTWNRYFAINATSQFLMAKAVIPHMKKNKFGRIINVASGVVMTPMPRLIPYMVSKNAVIAMTRGLATEMGVHGITVNAVTPSFVTSPGQIEVGSASKQPILTERQAIKRDCQPEDLAGLVVFLASDNAAFITAQTIHADGGLTYK